MMFVCRNLALALGLALAGVPATAAGTGVAPLALRYEAYAAGFPLVHFDFRLNQTEGGYVASGTIRSTGLLWLLYRFKMHAETEGRIVGEALQPIFHEHASRSRGRDRRARLEYPADGTVVAELAPPEDPGRPRPTAEQVEHTVDPLTAILAIGREVARSSRCDGSVAVYDGRRRYDLVLTDEGIERFERSPAYAFAGEARRCAVAAVKIAGFSFDQDYSPHTSHGRVWLAAPKPGAPMLPIRIDFDSGLGSITVRITAVDPSE